MNINGYLNVEINCVTCNRLIIFHTSVEERPQLGLDELICRRINKCEFLLINDDGSISCRSCNNTLFEGLPNEN